MAPASPPGNPGPSGFLGPPRPVWTPLVTLASSPTLDSRGRLGHLGGPPVFPEAGVQAPIGTLLLPLVGDLGPPSLGGRLTPPKQPEFQAPFTSSEPVSYIDRHTPPSTGFQSQSPPPAACQGSHLFSRDLGCLAPDLCPLHLFSSQLRAIFGVMLPGAML